MKNEMRYLTLEDKMEVIKERIIQGGFDEFDSNYSEEELDEMLENDTYYEEFRKMGLGAKGYENKTFDDLNEMDFEDILNVHNEFTRCKITLKKLDEMKVFYNASGSATTTMLDKDGDLIVVPMWMAL